jgi:hypothetical protein
VLCRSQYQRPLSVVDIEDPGTACCSSHSRALATIRLGGRVVGSSVGAGERRKPSRSPRYAEQLEGSDRGAERRSTAHPAVVLVVEVMPASS